MPIAPKISSFNPLLFGKGGRPFKSTPATLEEEGYENIRGIVAIELAAYVDKPIVCDTLRVSNVAIDVIVVS